MPDDIARCASARLGWTPATAAANIAAPRATAWSLAGTSISMQSETALPYRCRRARGGLERALCENDFLDGEPVPVSGSAIKPRLRLPCGPSSRREMDENGDSWRACA